MSAAAFQFDPVEHRYFLDGHEVPGVTRVIGGVFPELYAHSSEYAMDRGSRVHSAIHYWLEDDLDEESLGWDVVPYLNAAKQFVAESGIEVISPEQKVKSLTYRYAGTLDLLCIYNGKLTLADWKTGEPGWQAGLQTAAYAEAWREEGGDRVQQRIVVRLRQDGTYRVDDYESRHDLQRFLSALTVWNMKQEHL